MDLSDIAGSIVVPRQRALRLDQGDVRRVVVLAGNVWITEQGKLRDVLLQAGEEFVVERPADTVVSALGGDARIVLEGGADAELRRAPVLRAA
jgi:predicted NAD-dependent protein-ADP-ribosyltransferase YbiA (DUF1768 family)